MNWAGDWIQNNIEKTDTVLSLGCGIMQAILDHVKSYPDTRLECKELYGVDIYAPYLDFLNENYPEINTLWWDLKDVPLPFDDNSFDHVLLLDILEHLDNWEQIIKVVRESIRIARKKVFAIIPRKFESNKHMLEERQPYPYTNFGINKYQEHKMFITKDFLENQGFKLQKRGKVHYYGFKKLPNKILHIWDIAGVGSVMAKYQNRIGHESKVWIGHKADLIGFCETYKELNIINDTDVKDGGVWRKFKNYYNIWKSINKVIKDFEPDILHFHALEFLPLFFLSKRKLIEFHGTRVRVRYKTGKINEKRKTPRWIFLLYGLFEIPCYVSTPDLIDELPSYINPKG
jgi:hypothetical protein